MQKFHLEYGKSFSLFLCFRFFVAYTGYHVKLSEYEIMYFNDEPFIIPPESREEILQWLLDLTQSSKLAEETKEPIREAHRLLAAEWGKSA